MSVLGKRSHSSLDDNDEDTDELLHTAPKPKKQRLSNTYQTESKQKGDTIDTILDNEPIILNVGGIKYHTSIQTLTGFSSMLKARFSSQYLMKPSADGSYFIDRDGKMFEYILKYLRTGNLLLPSNWNKDNIWELYLETKYFMIKSLFNTVLLRLFVSNIVRNDVIKLKIMQKISETLHWTMDKTMESLKQWIVHESWKQSMHDSMGHSLLLIEADYIIYGVFLTMWKRKNRTYYNFNKSFSICCGVNSYHLCPMYNENDIEVVFKPLRGLSDEERSLFKPQVQDEESDDDDESIDNGSICNWYMSTYPLAIISDSKVRKGWALRHFQDKDPSSSVYVAFSNWELWSVPM